jgi:hypothetical protein
VPETDAFVTCACTPEAAAKQNRRIAAANWRDPDIRVREGIIFLLPENPAEYIRKSKRTQWAAGGGFWGGFRDDEISDLISMNCDSGWTFCRNLTCTLRYVKLRLLQNADFGRTKSATIQSPGRRLVTPVANGGAGFDMVQYDGWRGAVRSAVQAASERQSAAINFDAIAAN